MKTLKLIITAVTFGLALASCDMDKYPYDAIPLDKAIQSLKDCENLRNGLYRDLRIVSYGGNLIASEIQCDFFNPLIDYGNNYGPIYRWSSQAQEGTFETTWANGYVTIGQCNLLIGGLLNLEQSGKFSEEELPAAKNMLGEAYLMRAIAYAGLADKFCVAYDPETAGNEYGVPLVDTYEPTDDNSKYPARSSLEATFAFIKEDIRNAEENMTAEGSQSSIYLTVDALKAFKARIALWMHDWDTAITNAEAVINSNKYPLITDQDAFIDMWLNDNSTEVICQLFSSKQELAPSMGGFLDEKNDRPTFVPTQSMIDLFMEGEADIRLSAYFGVYPLNTSVGSGQIIMMHKFPGNPDMYTGDNNYVNKPKIFRVAELYLIAAEAYYNKGGKEKEAYDILFKLMSARDETLTSTPVTGLSLRKLIRNERIRELFGEGFRLTDLKRYGEGFKRGEAQIPEATYPLAIDLEVASTDFRFVWAIPKTELDTNPQLRPQQNPGY
ncbi:RagB/SusD family nutrient uptake outer membrane protein [Bacteroides sp.]